MTENAVSRRKGRAQVTAAEVPAEVQWSEGMLLAPQHFQRQSLRHELLIHYHAAAASPFHWGVRELEIDAVRLADGTFRVLELEAVLPDGLIVLHSPDDLPELSIDLKPRIDELKQGPLTVYLAVVARGGGLAQDERYAPAYDDKVRDENTGDGELQIAVLAPRLQLLVGEDIASKYVKFPLARIAYDNETYIRTPFQPPCLRVEPDSPIHGLCATLAARLRGKASDRVEQVRPPADAGPQLLDAKLFAHCLIGELPPFEALLDSRVAHPFPLYLALCSLLGHVAGVGRALVPPQLPPYDHNDLMASFQDAVDAISAFVAEATHEVYTSHRFRLEGDEFHLPFERDWMGREAILGVRAPSGVSDQDIAAWIKSSVIASRSKVVTFRTSRVRGAIRKQLESVPGLVPPAGVTLYSIEPKPEHILPGEDLVIVNPGERRLRRPASIVLYVHNRRAE